MPSPSPDPLLRRLYSDSATERLEAARYFAQHASPEHEQLLREAVGRERVVWIKTALRRAIARISPTPEVETANGSINRDDLPAGFAAQLYADALETTASQLMHEIEPLIGSLRLAAEAEVKDFEASNTRRALDRLDEFFAALSRLRRAASAPKFEEFQLDEAIQRCIDETQVPETIQVQRAGPQLCIVDGDSSLVTMSFANGLRNAIEATVSAGGDSARLPITVTWGTTDVDNWVSVVDLGIGFRGNLQRAFDIGTTTKTGHLGMGLAIAKLAMTSMEGKVLLVPNEHGVRFEMRWPRKTE